jgi:glycosyltransferase involved in cell wall biosynthesis
VHGLFIRPRKANYVPHVAVVVPCYKYGHYLEDCVSSIVQQTGVTTAILIIDDASHDDSFSVAERLSATYTNVTARRHTSNQGHIPTYNEGLAEADSDYVVLLSADDLLAPGALQRATGLMEAYRSVGLVYGRPQNFRQEIPSEERVRHTWSHWSGEAWIGAQVRRSLSIIYSPEAVVRTSVQHKVGYYNSVLPHSADLEMWLRIADVSDVGRVNGPIQAFRRIHSESMMQTGYSSLLADLDERLRAYESFFSNYKDGQALFARARRRMSTEALNWAAANCDSVSEEWIDRAVRFAKVNNPRYTRTKAWREYQWRSSQRTGARDALIGQISRVSRILGDKFRWRRWRYLGI